MGFTDSVLQLFQSDDSKVAIVSKNIGLLNAVSFVVSDTIGSGFFVAPVGVLARIGSIGGSIIVWLASAIISLLGALCYAELGMTYPESGNNYTYMLRIYGEIAAFFELWISLVITCPCVLAISSLIFANYALAPFSPCGPPPVLAVRIVSVLVLCLVSYINCQNVTWPTRTQGIFTSGTLFALIIIIVAGAYHMISGHTANFENIFENTSSDPGNITLAFYSSLYSYSGWTILNNIMEELKDPKKNYIRALYVSFPLITAIYLLTNVAYFAVLTPQEILSSDAVAMTFADRMLGVMSWIIYLFVAVSIFGSLNVNVFAHSRCYYVASREGHLPSFLSMIHIDSGSPTPCVIFQCVFCLSYLFIGDVHELISYSTFIQAVFSVLVVGGMLWLRIKQPDLERPIKVPVVVAIVYFGVCVCLATIAVYTRFWAALIGLGITLLGFPVYGVTVHWKDKSEFYAKNVEAFSHFIQKLLVVLPVEKEK